MTGDPRFAHRIIRLSATSLAALALVWLLEARTVNANPMVGFSLGAGWILMPSVLALSLRWPRLRYAVTVPAFLVGLALIAICLWSLPERPLVGLGWVLTTLGTLLGGILGAWFWFRLLPVPGSLQDPFSRGRWALIAVHVALIVTGLVLVGISTLD
jgi:hypothetical protein